jgi:thymidine kinase
MASGVGYLELYLGPMFSGKTSALVQAWRRYTIAKKRVLVLNHSLDDRYSDNSLSTHDGKTIPCRFAKCLADFDAEVEHHDVILINEGQFFTDIYQKTVEWVEERHKTVIVCGLDGTSERQTFGDLCSLIPIADKYEKLTSVCVQCGNVAPFTFRSAQTSNGQVIQIGVKEYSPLCRKCFQKAKKDESQV